MNNKGVLLWPFLLVFLLFLSHCSCLVCPPDRGSQGQPCECAESKNGYLLFCPQKVDARVHLVWKEELHGQGEVILTCLEEVSSKDMIHFLESLKMENLSKMSVKRCPVSKSILQELVKGKVEGGLDILVLEDITSGYGVGSDSVFDWDGLKGVNHLEIFYSDGLIVGADMFRNMKKLETVILRDNTNTVVEDKAFAILEDLRNLELSKCDINQLQVNSFVNLRKLKKLQLNSNHLKNLPVGIFQDLENLEELNLSLNRLESLSDEIFGNLKQLERVNLNYNQLAALPGEVFRNTSRLTRLEISNNALGSIPSNIIKTLTNLKFLDISSNQLTKLDQIIFQMTQQLAHLHLQNNQLKRINLSKLGHINSVLASLDLSNNLLVSADIGSGIFGKLTTINMSNNRIRGAFTGTLTINCRRLKYLDLSHNNYNGTIKKKHLDVFKRNLTLNLSHNGITRVDMTPPRYLRYMLSSSNYHTEVMLKGNPMVCDCFSSELKQRLQGKNIQESGLVFQDFSCEDSTSLSPRKVLH